MGQCIGLEGWRQDLRHLLWLGEGDFPRFSFKCSDISYSLLTQQEGMIPAPYLARAKWVQMEEEGALSDADLKAYIEAAHKIIAAKLTRKQQKELGLAG